MLSVQLLWLATHLSLKCQNGAEFLLQSNTAVSWRFWEIHVVCSLVVFREYFFCTITDGSPRWTLTDNENKQPDSKLLSTVYLKLFLWWWNSLWNINCFLPISSKRLKYICFLGFWILKRQTWVQEPNIILIPNRQILDDLLNSIHCYKAVIDFMFVQ